MQAITNKLETEAGLTHEQAVKALDVIKNHIQAMLPPMMQPMVENFLSGGSNNPDF